MERVHLEVRTSTGCEYSEATLPRHLVVLYRCPTDDVEVSFDGSKAMRGTRVGRSVSVHPAQLRYEARRLAKMGERRELVALALAPRFLARVSGTERYELVPTFGREDALAEQLVAALEREARTEQGGEGIDSLYAQSLLVALAAHLTRRYARPSARGRIDDLQRFIAERLDQSLTLEELATFAECDVRAFTRWFRDELGLSPHRYVIQARVARAKELLTRTREPLAAIALACGFSSQSHFTTVFRRETGHTPARFRKA